MSTSEEKIREFIVAREGEIEGLENFLGHISERHSGANGNVERVQMTSTAILAALDRINVAIDSQLLKIDSTNSETLVQQLLDLIAAVRRAVRTEEQTATREFGFVYGTLNMTSETGKTLSEKISSAKSSIANQKELLKRAESGDISERTVGERPVSLKDQRKFDEIVNSEE